jgi:hypothetical protein
MDPGLAEAGDHIRPGGDDPHRDRIAIPGLVDGIRAERGEASCDMPIRSAYP